MSKLLLVLAVLALGLAYWYRVGGRTAPRPYVRKQEPYTQVGVSRTYKQAVIPVPDERSPLSPALARVVDPVVPMPTAGEALPYDHEEVRSLFEGVVARVNAKTPGLGLALVSFENVRKTVDQYKAIKYEADLTVYAKARNITSKVVAAVDVTAKGMIYVRTLKVPGAAKDTGVVASNGPGTEEQYAAFEPAVKY